MKPWDASTLVPLLVAESINTTVRESLRKEHMLSPSPDPARRWLPPLNGAPKILVDFYTNAILPVR